MGKNILLCGKKGKLWQQQQNRQQENTVDWGENVAKHTQHDISMYVYLA